MKNLLHLPKNMYDLVVPMPQERWERSGMTDQYVVKYDKSGREITAPVFDVGLAQPVENIGVREFGNKQNPAGKVYVDRFVLNDGMTRLTQTWIPYDIQAEFTATSGMAFTTMVEGYDQDRAEMLALLGIPNIQVSAEQGDKHWPDLREIKRLGWTALHAPEISIAKSAQAETEMIAHLVHVRYPQLSQLIEAHGDSRGSKTSFGRAVYSGLTLPDSDNTPMYDLTPVWIDPKAVVVHDRLPVHKFHKVLEWLIAEALGSPPLVAELALEKKLLSLRGTASLNPSFITACLLGTAPALLGGETGELVTMLPDDVRGFTNGYVGDKLYDQINWQNGLRPYPNLYLNEVDRALHANLLSMRGLRPQLGRLARLAEESREHGAAISMYDIQYISDRSSHQFAVQKDSNLQVAA